MPSVYLETTILSYLVARPSRDLIVAGHQQITHEWWQSAADRFELFISDYVWSEIQFGDPDMISRRMDLARRLQILEFSDDVLTLTEQYRQRVGLTGRAEADLPHVAFAVSYRMDYLLTWNCKHIANGEVIRKLIEVHTDLHRRTPLIITPEELLPVI